MRRPAKFELSVECVAEMLRPLLNKVAAASLGFTASPRKPEDGLPQRFSSDWRSISALFATLVFVLATPVVFAQPAQFPAQGTSAPNASTPVQLPATPPGGSTQAQLLLAEQQGKADTALLDWVLANSRPVEGDIRAGELRVAYTITPAEGWWDKTAGGTLAWHEAPADNVHLRIFVLNLADGRMVPGLNLRATLTDANGNEQSLPVAFGWYPLMNAYGGNFPLDADSVYSLRVTVERGAFERSTVAEFPPVPIVLDEISQLPLATATGFANEAELLKPSNAALSAAITALWKHSASGIEKPSGDYFVAYALDYSGLAMPLAGGELHPKNLIEFSGKDNVRLTLLIRDSRTGRLIPNLKPQASLIAADGKLYGPGELPLVTHSWLYHYGRNDRIPRKGIYKLRVHFDAPGFRRWGKQSERFAVPAEVEFDDVSLQPGKKD